MTRPHTILIACAIAGFGLLKGLRLLVDAFDDAVTLPRSVQ